MTTAREVLNIEKRYVRHKPYYPPNIFSYGNNEPWCADFQRYCLEKAGMKSWVSKFPFRFCNCEAIWKYAGKIGCRKYSGKPGDLVIFDWNKDNIGDHIGMVIKKNKDGSYVTVEGNTSNINNSNGNCVQIRTREVRFIRGFVRPPYKAEKPLEPKKEGTYAYKGKKMGLNRHRDGLYLHLGDHGSKNVKRLQKFLNWYGNAGLEVDGVFGKMTMEAVYAFQKSQGLTCDGIVGKDTLAVIHKFYKG